MQFQILPQDVTSDGGGCPLQFKILPQTVTSDGGGCPLQFKILPQAVTSDGGGCPLQFKILPQTVTYDGGEGERWRGKGQRDTCTYDESPRKEKIGKPLKKSYL